MRLNQLNTTLLAAGLAGTLILSHQNCQNKGPIEFLNNRQTLTSSQASASGGSYDGKPQNGTYCRVFDNLQCIPTISDIQGLLVVTGNKLDLIQDTCASTATHFLNSDPAVTYTELMPEYIGLTRGTFKLCESKTNIAPPSPTQMTEAYCVSAAKDVALAIDKNLTNQDLTLTLNFRAGTQIRTVVKGDLERIQDNTATHYTSSGHIFNLVIESGVGQTTVGHLVSEVDQNKITVDLDCRTASPEPAVIINRDFELSPTWIDTTRLVGYWKLNEPNVLQGSVLSDSSVFNLSGVFNSGGDTLIKNDLSVKGGALAFDGNDDRIVVPKATDAHLDFGLNSFSYMVWIKKTGNAGTWDIPLWHGGSNPNLAGYDIECGSSSVGCYAELCDGKGLTTSIVKAKFATASSSLIGRWVLLTAVVDRSTNQFRAYLDGTLVSTSSLINLGSVTTDSLLSIGDGPNGSYSFLGSIDDVAIWNLALTDAKIAEIFARLRPKFY